MRYDGLDTTRRLNVSTDELRASYRAGETVTFRSSMNYPAYVTRTEVRILDRSRARATRSWRPCRSRRTEPPTGRCRAMGRAITPMCCAPMTRRDGTTRRQALALMRTERAFPTHATAGAPFVAAGEGEDRTRIRRIPVSGGMVTVSGTDARPGSTVRVNGEAVPVDARGRFVTTRILPAGDRVVIVDIDGQRHRRDVTIPSSEWFRVGIIDITAGWRDDESESAKTRPMLTAVQRSTPRARRRAAGRSPDRWTPVMDRSRIFSSVSTNKDPRRVIERLREKRRRSLSDLWR